MEPTRPARTRDGPLHADVFGFTPFGNLAIGMLAERWGMSVIILLNAACAFILAAIVIALVPPLRKMP